MLQPQQPMPPPGAKECRVSRLWGAERLTALPFLLSTVGAGKSLETAQTRDAHIVGHGLWAAAAAAAIRTPRSGSANLSAA